MHCTLCEISDEVYKVKIDTTVDPDLYTCTIAAAEIGYGNFNSTHLGECSDPNCKFCINNYANCESCKDDFYFDENPETNDRVCKQLGDVPKHGYANSTHMLPCANNLCNIFF